MAVAGIQTETAPRGGAIVEVVSGLVLWGDYRGDDDALVPVIAAGMGGTVCEPDSRRSARLWALWVANIVAAVLFGLGHLPAFISAGYRLTRSSSRGRLS